GDPIALIAPLTASKQFEDDLRQQLGFADPLPEQYLRFLGDALHGDFGISSWLRVPALPLVLSRLPATWQLAGTTMGIALFVGIGDPWILVVHALQNAAIPMLTVGADEFASLLNGSVIVETIFGWPGIGFLTTQAITNRDLSVITAAVLVVGIQLVLVNLAIDL